MRWRPIAISLALLIGTVEVAVLWRYHHSPRYAVKELRAAYEKQDAARAQRFLTSQGRTLFTLALDPDDYTPLVEAKTELKEETAAAATVHFHGLTRFGPLDADLRLIHAEGRWELDDVFLISVGGADIHQTASSLQAP